MLGSGRADSDLQVNGHAVRAVQFHERPLAQPLRQLRRRLNRRNPTFRDGLLLALALVVGHAFALDDEMNGFFVLAVSKQASHEIGFVSVPGTIPEVGHAPAESKVACPADDIGILVEHSGAVRF